jgi:DNA-binding response OmpR family regulator
VKKQTIILVEADIVARHPLAEYLRDCGYLVAEAVNVDEARALVSSAKTGFDVALIDAATVGEGGFVLVQWLRQNYPATAISITGNMEKIADEARKLCDDVPNPLSSRDHGAVLNHIKRLLAARDRAKKTE